MTKTQFVLQVIAFVVAVVMLPFLLVFGCGKGCEPHGNVCACTEPPQAELYTYIPADEKPHHNRIPAWADGTVKADMGTLSKDDDEKAKADREGKKSAGIN